MGISRKDANEYRGSANKGKKIGLQLHNECWQMQMIWEMIQKL